MTRDTRGDGSGCRSYNPAQGFALKPVWLRHPMVSCKLVFDWTINLSVQAVKEPKEVSQGR